MRSQFYMEAGSMKEGFAKQNWICEKNVPNLVKVGFVKQFLSPQKLDLQ